MKLSKELAKRSTGHTLYILDEPTTGLHFESHDKLLEVLHELVEQGNTVIVIEHNLDVNKTADWIIDIGPEGGDGGGAVVACHTRRGGAGTRKPYGPLPETDVGRKTHRASLSEYYDFRLTRKSIWHVRPAAFASSACPPAGRTASQNLQTFHFVLSAHYEQ